MEKTTPHVFRRRAVQLWHLRWIVLHKLFVTRAEPSGVEAPILNDIANSLSRFAAFQQTAFDSGASRSSNGNEAASMERQVERAFIQVLGRGIGRGRGSIVPLLDSTFPTVVTSEGRQVVFTPTRSVVSLSPSDGSDAAALADKRAGFAGTISARQANLYRQATVIAGDAMRVLNGLTPFVPEAESDQVEALRALVRSEIEALVDEFGRLDEPRNERVWAYFSALKMHLAGFGRRSFLDDPSLAATVEDEAQLAGFELLKSYSNALRNTWETFYNVDRRSTRSFSLSERVERANIMLPVIDQANADLMAAMDSVGFLESERRSMNAKFTALAGYLPAPVSTEQQAGGQISASVKYRPQITTAGRRSLIIRDLEVEASEALQRIFESKGQITPTAELLTFIGDVGASLPDITVYDLTEWVDRLANIEGPSILNASGLYALDFITEQADRIFWVVVPVVAHLALNAPTPPSASLSLEQSLSNERVRFALNNLLGQLGALADLSVPGANQNAGMILQ